MKTPPARLLDVTRLVRRAGQVMTGVDRVELAYLEALSDAQVPCWGIARTRLGYVLLAPHGLAHLRGAARGHVPWPTPKGVARLDRGTRTGAQAALTLIRRHAAARCLPYGLGRMLARHMPPGTHYVNVGHSNLTQRMLSAAQRMRGKIAVFVHDIIPVEFPQYQRDGTAQSFAAKLKIVRAYADLLICNSHDTARRLLDIMADWGPVPEVIVSHLGTERAAPRRDDLPPHLPPNGPYFVCLGTIEPRKNHALLLDIWEDLDPPVPTLVIAGRRGWNNADVFARLDALSSGGAVIEAPGLSDGAVAALLQGARALLFPSRAEGYGLPAMEAAALGVPVIASDLPALREVLENIAVYASPTDRYSWKKAILDHAAHGKEAPKFAPPTWQAHFKTVLTKV
ncbi:MAG: glycosyltransferase family 1 protein [Pseudomonadota bacterium]